MKWCIQCLILISSSLCFTQQQTIDSLLLELPKYSTENSERVEILNQLAYHYHMENPDTGLQHANEAINLAKSLQLKDLEARAYKNRAYNLTALAKDSLAHISYEKVIQIQSELENWDEVGRASFNKGLLYFNKSFYREAISCNTIAYQSFEKENDSLLMATVLNSLATNQMYLTRYPDAIETYLRASSIYESANATHTTRHAEVLINLGILYSRLEKHDLALEYYKKSLEVNTILKMQQ